MTVTATYTNNIFIDRDWHCTYYALPDIDEEYSVINRRRFLQMAGGLLVAAPAVVRAASLMPIQAPKTIIYRRHLPEFFAYAHPDLLEQIRDMPEFVPVHQYAEKIMLSPNEVGSFDGNRIFSDVNSLLLSERERTKSIDELKAEILSAAKPRLILNKAPARRRWS